MANKYHCSNCNVHFDYLSTYKRHLNSNKHSKMVNYPYFCTYCNSHYETNSQYIAHMGKFHDIEIINGINYKCKTCNIVCETKYHYMRHIKSKKHLSLVLKDTFYCELCNIYFKDNNSLTQHLSSIEHQNKCFNVANLNKKKHECSYCGKKYLHERSLKRHLIKCNNQIIIKKNEVDDSKIKKLQEQMEEQNKFILEQQEIVIKQQNALIKQQNTFSTISNSLHNVSIVNNITTNNHFNFNIFLENECKNAIDISKFMNSIAITFEELEKCLIHGVVPNIVEIFNNNINKLDKTIRPIHCSDKKRQKIHIKQNDTWNIDNEHNTLKQIVDNINYKQNCTLKYWMDNIVKQTNGEVSHDLMDKYFDITTKIYDEYAKSNNNAYKSAIKQISENVYVTEY